MLTRRTMLLASVGGGALLALRSGNAHAAAPSTVKTPINFDVPRAACDCHVHDLIQHGFRISAGGCTRRPKPPPRTC